MGLRPFNAWFVICLLNKMFNTSIVQQTLISLSSSTALVLRVPTMLKWIVLKDIQENGDKISFDPGVLK
jgi:hypothetical protein